MKKWENPELKNLALGETNTEGECEGQKNETASRSSLPNLILWCTRWDSEKRCTHPNWKPNNCDWPCKQAPVHGGGSN